jgi:epoxide hydrolase-like predicted phosphatase
MDPQKPSIRAVGFDFGGVITDDPFRLMGRAAIEAGIDPADFATIAVGRGDYGSGDHPWHQLERGEIEVEDFNRATNEMAITRGYAGFPQLPIDMILGGILTHRSEMLDLLSELRGNGIATGILTNNIRALGAWRELADWDAMVDVVVDSCEVGMRKPEARIFRHFCAELGVDPTQTGFLDDMQANVDGAIAVGMHGILVSEPSAAIEEVRRLLA